MRATRLLSGNALHVLLPHITACHAVPPQVTFVPTAVEVRFPPPRHAAAFIAHQPPKTDGGQVRSLKSYVGILWARPEPHKSKTEPAWGRLCGGTDSAGLLTYPNIMRVPPSSICVESACSPNVIVRFPPGSPVFPQSLKTS